MDDRIAEIRAAFERVGRSPGEIGTVEAILGAPEDLNTILDAARAWEGLLDSDALIIRRDEFYDPHDDLIALRDFIDKRESLEFPDIGEVSNQLAAIIAKLTVVDVLASSQGVEP